MQLLMLQHALHQHAHPSAENTFDKYSLYHVVQIHNEPFALQKKMQTAYCGVKESTMSSRGAVAKWSRQNGK